MVIAAIFWLFMLATYALVLLYGDRDARWFIQALVVSATLTIVARASLDKPQAAAAVLAIDATVLALALWLVARSNSYWPTWFAGFLVIDVCTLTARYFFPHHVFSVYTMIAAFWVLPAQFTMLAVIIRDHRAGIYSRSGLRS